MATVTNQFLLNLSDTDERIVLGTGSGFQKTLRILAEDTDEYLLLQNYDSSTFQIKSNKNIDFISDNFTFESTTLVDAITINGTTGNLHSKGSITADGTIGSVASVYAGIGDGTASAINIGEGYTAGTTRFIIRGIGTMIPQSSETIIAGVNHDYVETTPASGIITPSRVLSLNDEYIIWYQPD